MPNIDTHPFILCVGELEGQPLQAAKTGPLDPEELKKLLDPMVKQSRCKLEDCVRTLNNPSPEEEVI